MVVKKIEEMTNKELIGKRVLILKDTLSENILPEHVGKIALIKDIIKPKEDDFGTEEVLILEFEDDLPKLKDETFLREYLSTGEGKSKKGKCRILLKGEISYVKITRDEKKIDETMKKKIKSKIEEEDWIFSDDIELDGKDIYPFSFDKKGEIKSDITDEPLFVYKSTGNKLYKKSNIIDVYIKPINYTKKESKEKSEVTIKKMMELDLKGEIYKPEFFGTVETLFTLLMTQEDSRDIEKQLLNYKPTRINGLKDVLENYFNIYNTYKLKITTNSLIIALIKVIEEKEMFRMVK